MKKIIVIAALVAGMGSMGSAMAAGDAAAGKVKAAVCAACHGANGISVNAMWPNLAGQKADYIIKQLKAFKAGTRKDPLMSPQAAQLSDQDIENVAAHFSSLK
ncbi:c-type cytochrome [Thiolapillus brandeum]|uniref:Cytochrome c, class I n=1 Tax=Thiolapillus brandeum TaxID=1076588 RepID=A0A7U6GLC2_9GAMM|nr:cytochrome c [Thiolapillus brandeum]BAO45740.1 cytochrome c, class I [Thiolapillus brandeum]